jgi:hypothetical protein
MQENQTPAQAEIFHIIGGYWLSRAVYLAARLKLADAVGDRPTSLASIAAVTGAKLENLRRLMRALAGHGFFRDEGNETFGQLQCRETLEDNIVGFPLDPFIENWRTALAELAAGNADINLPAMKP